MLRLSLLIALASSALAEQWMDKYGSSPDLSFSGITTFARLPHHRCLEEERSIDIAVVGFPFDVRPLRSQAPPPG